MTTGLRIVYAVSLLALVALLVLVTGQRRQATGFQAADLALDEGVPATAYLPGGAPGPGAARFGVRQPGPPGEAAVVVAHGYAADRATMRALSESLAAAGYVVVAIDEAGHGLNPRSLRTGSGRPDYLTTDVAAAVEWLRTTRGVAAERIVLLGHSMGARAVFTYAAQRGGVAGLALLAGADDRPGPFRPRNALLVYAERDLPGIEDLVRATAASLAGTGPVAADQTYGDVAAGTAVRLVRIPGVNHGGLVTSPVAFAEVLAWVDRVTGHPARAAAATLRSAPLGSPLVWLAFLLTLPGLGALLGRLAPSAVAEPLRTSPLDLPTWLLGLLLPLPFLPAASAGLLAGRSHADLNVTHLALAGLVLVASLVLARRVTRWPVAVPSSLAVGALGAVAVGTLLSPASAYLHGTALTADKAQLALWSAACLLPLAWAFHRLCVRARGWRGALLRIGGRLLALLVVVAGNAAGVFGFPGTIALFVLIAGAVLLEPVFAGFYLRSRNLVAAAGLEALVLGWLFALYLPLSY
jgi:dienelactone hydrolase